MNSQDYYKRIISVFRPEQLRSKHAIIIGAGSGGGRVATELGRLGLPLTLVDRPGEALEEHNICRHELGYASLGKLKVTELARHINNFNPATPITTAELDVTAQPEAFSRLIEHHRPDILVAATDNLASKHAINAAALRHALPVVGAGVYDGGIGGECYLTQPGAACFACIATHLQLKEIAPKRELNIDYNDLDLDAVRSTAALNLDIAQIALIHARLVLNRLLDSNPDETGIPPEVNLIVFANRPMPGVFQSPLNAQLIHFSRLPDCLVCGARTDPAILQQADNILATLNPAPPCD